MFRGATEWKPLLIRQEVKIRKTVVDLLVALVARKRARTEYRVFLLLLVDVGEEDSLGEHPNTNKRTKYKYKYRKYGPETNQIKSNRAPVKKSKYKSNQIPVPKSQM